MLANSRGVHVGAVAASYFKGEDSTELFVHVHLNGHVGEPFVGSVVVGRGEEPGMARVLSSESLVDRLGTRGSATSERFQSAKYTSRIGMDEI